MSGGGATWAGGGSLQGESGWQGGGGGDRKPRLSPILVLGLHPTHLPAPPGRDPPTLPDPHLSHPQPPNAWSHHPIPREPSDLEELEQFARTFKQRRIRWVSHRSEAARQDRRRDPLRVGGWGPRYLVGGSRGGVARWWQSEGRERRSPEWAGEGGRII